MTVSLLWIGWSGYEILNENNNYQPEKLFGSSDKGVLIINRPEEIRFELLSEYATSPALPLISSIPTDLYKTAYLSRSRGHLLLIGNKNWTRESIQDALKLNPEKVTFDKQLFKVGDYNGRFHKTSLYLYKSDVNPGKSGITTFIYDKNASAAEFTFESETSFSVKDIYFKKDGKLEFISHSNGYNGNQIRDEEIFAYQLTAHFDSYHFYERAYYASMDKIFKEGPMNKWVFHGFVEIIYDGEKILISDYLDGQEPDLILKDKSQNSGAENYSVPLTENFPEKGKSYTVKYLEDLAIFSEKPDIADRIISDFKLGKTIALTPEVKQKVYGELPKRVSERFISNKVSQTKAVYNEKLIETHPGNNNNNNKNQSIKEDQSQLSFACNFNPIDFVLGIDGANLIVLGSNGEIAGFKNQKRSWQHTLEGKILGSISLIDLYNNGEFYLLVNTTEEIHLLDMNGNYSSGFPVKLENPAVNPVKFYRWKEKSYFIVEDQKQQIVIFNGKGNELNIFKSGILTGNQIDIWASKGKLFAGIGNESHFEMIELERGKKYRDFTIPKNSKTVKSSNELFHFALENDHLVRIDQKGIKSTFGRYPNGHIIEIVSDDRNVTIKIKVNNTLYHINGEGIEFSKIALPFNELASSTIKTSHGGSSMIAVVDGLENNVYLYGLNGKKIDGGSFEGETKVVLANHEEGAFVYTIVDQFIVRYRLKY